jgi:hypothetical protein
MASLWESIVEGGRDPRLGWFEAGGKLHGQLPSGHVLGALECLRPAGPSPSRNPAGTNGAPPPAAPSQKGRNSTQPDPGG